MDTPDYTTVEECCHGAVGQAGTSTRNDWLRCELIVVLFAAFIFLTGVISPPSLMDDVDASQATMARNMLRSGDWVSARLDGVLYIDKAPFKYWETAVGYMIFGVHDWVARLPGALSAILLCWLAARFGRWAFSAAAGLYAGLILATCVGLFLFTRIVIPDVTLTLVITLSLWALLRVLDGREQHPRRWAAIWAVTFGVGLLVKGLIGLVFPLAIALLYLSITRRILDRRTWKLLHPFWGLLIFVAIAAPWHVLAILRNPPYFDFTLHSGPGYRGFFWFYFINDQLLRFLNLRYPRDYNTVPRPLFWLLHLVWLFPWSVYFPLLRKLNFRPTDRQGQTACMALCWTGFVLVFFTFSTTQEYYSMPVYPALALLLGAAMALVPERLYIGARAVGSLALVGAVIAAVILVAVRGVATPGDISVALTQNPDAYTLSMGHLSDLTVRAFAYLRAPLLLAGIACLIAAVGAWTSRDRKTVFALVFMMVVFFQAVRLALVVFDPYLSSRPLADALNRAPKGRMISSGEYYNYSALFFYAEDRTLMLNGRYANLEYGSYAPGAPDVFIDDARFRRLWAEPVLSYFAVGDAEIPRIQTLVGPGSMHLIGSAGGRSLFANRAVASNPN